MKYGDAGWFRILGPADVKQRGGILTFEIKRPNPIGIAEELSDKANVMVRDGLFCVHSYLNYSFWFRLDQAPAALRAPHDLPGFALFL